MKTRPLPARRIFAASLLLAGCADDPAAAPAGAGIEVQVAPLQLTGIGYACYDVAVFNGIGQPVWSAGDPAVAHPTDRSTLCSTRFGNGPGGGIAYVGPCDGDAPDHEVSLVLDGLYDAAGRALDDYRNPCPADRPCVLPVECRENTDSPVTFNLTLMRQANQGFFDIAVNFDDIFCSAKVDCTYDDAGDDPIELLFDPATQERAQTAVVAVACTAGPGSDVTTTLLMNDVRVECGEVETPTVEQALFSCDDAGTMFIGVLQAFSSSSLTLMPVEWTRQADGSYTAQATSIAAFDSQYGDVGVPVQITQQVTSGSDLVTTALGVTITLDMSQNPPFSRVQTVFFTRTNLGPWQVSSVVGIHPDSPRTIAFPTESPTDNYLLMFDTPDGDSVNPFVTLALRSSGNDYPDLFHLRRPSSYSGSCSRDVSTGSRFVLMTCQHGTTGDWDILAWDITASPTTPSGATGPGLDPDVMPLGPSSLSFSGGVSATAVTAIETLGSVPGNISANDRIFATARVRLSDSTSTTQLVHFRRAGGTWPLEHVPFAGADPLPTTALANTWDPARQTHLAHVVELGGGGVRDIVQGGLFFQGQWRHFAARYDRANNSWSTSTELESAAGVPLAHVGYTSGVFGDASRYYLTGGGAVLEGGPLRPFITPFGTSVVTFLPMPDNGWTFLRMTGSHGDTSLAATARRVTGLVVDPSGHRMVIEWRFDVVLGALQLADWYVYGPTDPILEADANWSELDALAQSGARLSPLLSPYTNRCSALLERYDTGPSNSEVEQFLIAEPTLDQGAQQTAVSQVSTLSPTTGDLDGTLIVRDRVGDTSALVAVPSGSLALLDPSQPQGGNVWTAANPKPAGTPAHILQYATYFGDEALGCDAEPCNKLYWSTAIAFDPTVPGCSLAFEATAAQTSSLVGGQIPNDASWPLIIGRVPLTNTPTGETAPVEMLCRQHPLGSNELQTLYKPQLAAFPFCHALGPSRGPATASDLACGYTAQSYLELDRLIARGFGVGRSSGGDRPTDQGQ